MKQFLILTITFLFLTACTTTGNEYYRDNYPNASFKPINISNNISNKGQ